MAKRTFHRRVHSKTNDCHTEGERIFASRTETWVILKLRRVIDSEWDQLNDDDEDYMVVNEAQEVNSK